MERLGLSDSKKTNGVMYLRKFSCFLLAFLLIGTLLSGCSGKPDGMSDSVYEWGCQALEATDNYLNNKTTVSSAASTVEELSDKISDFYDGSADTATKDLTLSLSVSRLSFQLKTAASQWGSADIDAIQEARDSVAKILGK